MDDQTKRPLKSGTRLAQALGAGDPTTKALVPPTHMSATYPETRPSRDRSQLASLGQYAPCVLCSTLIITLDLQDLDAGLHRNCAAQDSGDGRF
jgi:hypothetical protein